MSKEMMPKAGIEKKPEEIAQEAVEDFFEAYKIKYSNRKDAIENSVKYLKMLEDGSSIDLITFLQEALNKYKKMQQQLHTIALDKKEKLDEKAILEYKNMEEKAEAAIEVLKTLE